MEWNTIREWARRFYPDVDATWDDDSCQAYYWHEYAKWLRAQHKAA